ncbi:MAG: ribosomal protein S19 family protein [Candidatus Woesearchaeota archaeon]
MAKKEFTYRGKTLDVLQKMSTKEFAGLVPSRSRRKLLRGLTDAEKLFVKSVEVSSKPVKTHCRDMIVLPFMVGKTIKVHRGNTFEDVIVEPEMLGYRLGEFALSRKRAKHNDAGVGKKKSKVNVR